jgi:hypothetical protein
MKKLFTLFFLIALTAGLFFVAKNSTKVTSVSADAGELAPTITATYDPATGQLNTSGSYTLSGCDSKNTDRIVGFALFANGAFPSSSAPGVNALDGTGMHLANSGNPCTTSPGSWSDNSHILASAPTSVCVVVYDVRSGDATGSHSQIGAGSNYNTDNSYNNNQPSDGYSESSCVTPSINPTPTPTPTPSPTPGNPGGGGSGGSGGGSTFVCTLGTPGDTTLVSVVKDGSDSVKLSWTGASGATDYVIEYGLNSGNYTYGVPSTGNVTSYVIGSLDLSKSYYFKVIAVNGCRQGNPSNELQTAFGGPVKGLSNTSSEDNSIAYLFGSIAFIASGLGLVLKDSILRK